MLDETTLPATSSGFLEFQKCLSHLHDQNKYVALAHVRRALKIEPLNPFYLSYMGLLTGLVEKRYEFGEKFCREALKVKCNHAQLYLNLAELYHHAKRDQDAIATLKKGFISAGRDARIRRALQMMGGRRPPVLASLGRNHPVNRILGRLRHRMIGPRREK